MPIPVFTYVDGYPTRVKRVVSRKVFDLGAGYIDSVQSEIAHSRADGKGTVSSYKGTNVFTVTLPASEFEATGGFKDILAFLQARVDAGDEAFYFYMTPTERATADATGADTAGRYLVKFLDDIEFLLEQLEIYRFAQLTFREVFA